MVGSQMHLNNQDALLIYLVDVSIKIHLKKQKYTVMLSQFTINELFSFPLIWKLIIGFLSCWWFLKVCVFNPCEKYACAIGSFCQDRGEQQEYSQNGGSMGFTMVERNITFKKQLLVDETILIPDNSGVVKVRWAQNRSLEMEWNVRPSVNVRKQIENNWISLHWNFTPNSVELFHPMTGSKLKVSTRSTSPQNWTSWCVFFLAKTQCQRGESLELKCAEDSIMFLFSQFWVKIFKTTPRNKQIPNKVQSNFC